MCVVLGTLGMVVCMNAQNSFGIKAGLNLTYLADRYESGISSQDVNDMLSGYHAGLFYQSGGEGLLGFRAELLFSLKGEQDEVLGLSTAEDVRLSYVSLPLLLTLRPVDLFLIEAGLEPSVLVSTEPALLDPENDFDLGVVAGFSIPLIDDRLLLGARFSFGLSEIYEITITDENGVDVDKVGLHNRALQIWAGFRF